MQGAGRRGREVHDRQRRHRDHRPQRTHHAETTNGGIKARDVGGRIEASTTNGGVDVDLAAVAERGVKLECTNGGIELRLPPDAKATISASITNGGIDDRRPAISTRGESTRRRLEGS